MRLSEFSEIIKREFGSKLEYATPANVQEFLANFYGERIRKRAGRYDIIEEEATSYEEIVKEFLVSVLENPTDDAIVHLWLLTLELLFAVIEPLERERIGRFLNHLQEDD